MRFGWREVASVNGTDFAHVSAVSLFARAWSVVSRDVSFFDNKKDGIIKEMIKNNKKDDNKKDNSNIMICRRKHNIIQNACCYCGYEAED